MPIEFLINFFNKLYLQNTIILFLLILFFSYLINHKNKLLENVNLWMYKNIYTILILVIFSYFFNFFFPFTGKNSLFLFLLINLTFGVYFLATSGIKSINRDLNYIKKNKNLTLFFKKILFYLLLVLFFAIYFNFSIFKTNVPYSWGVNVDLYAHTAFINQLQNENLISWCIKDNKFICSLKDFLFLYPRGSHSLVAFLDKLLPFSFVNKTDYGFILFAIFTVSILSLGSANKIKIFFILPIIFLPSFSIMLLRDHINSALFLISAFVIYKKIIEIFIKENYNLSNFLKLFVALLSGYFIYHFSLFFLSLPIIIFLIFFKFFHFLKNKKSIILWFFNIVLLIVFGVFFYNFFQSKLDFIFNIFKGVFASAKYQHLVDIVGFNLRVNFLDFLGYKIFSYNYFTQYKDAPFFQYTVICFWVFLFLSIILNIKENFLVSIFLFFNFIFFIILDFIFGYSYLQIRYYSYLSVLLLIYLLNFQFKLKNKFFYLILICLSFLSIYWFYQLHMNNQVFARTKAAENIKLDYIVPSFILNTLKNDEVVLINHKQDYNRAFWLFLPYNSKNIYTYDRWDGRLINELIIHKDYLDYNKRSFISINLNKVDYIVSPTNFDFIPQIVDIIYRFDQYDTLFIKNKVKNYDIIPLFENKKIKVKEFFEKLDNKKFYLGKLYFKNQCFYFYGEKQKIEDYFNNENLNNDIVIDQIFSTENLNINSLVKTGFYFCN